MLKSEHLLMIKSFNSGSFKVIFSIYTSCQKYCVIAESHSYVYCHSQYFNISILYIYIYYLVKMELKSKLSQKLSIVKCIRKSQTCFKYKLIVTVNISRSSF